MSPDIATQVREYLRTLDSDAAPITIEELERAAGSVDGEGLFGDGVLAEYVLGPEGVAVPEVIPSRAPRRRWIAIGVAVAAAILLVVGLVVLIDRDGDGVVTDSDPVSEAGFGDPAQLEWSRVPHDEATFAGPGGLYIESVTAGGPGLVAVGSANGAGEDDPSSAAVWTSVDGVSWSRVPHDEATLGGSRNVSMASVTAGGPGLVAVGSADPHDGEDGVAWTSVDGTTWSRVPDDEEVFGGPGDQYIFAVTAGGPGLVVVGADFVGSADAMVWTSVDGVNWSRVPDEGLGSSYHDGMAAVTVGGPGLVAVGSAWDAGQTAAAWTSVDGLTWSKVPYDPEDPVFGAGARWIYGVTVGGPGLVAVGMADGPDGEGGDAAVWTSVDGFTWSRVPHDEALFGGPGHQEMTDVTAAGSGLVAVGVDESQDGEVSAVWTSTDGLTWTRVPDDEAIFTGGMSSVITTESGVVAVGGDGPNAAVWVGMPGD